MYVVLIYTYICSIILPRLFFFGAHVHVCVCVYVCMYLYSCVCMYKYTAHSLEKGLSSSMLVQARMRGIAPSSRTASCDVHSEQLVPRKLTVSNETQYSVKRDLVQCQKRPSTVSKKVSEENLRLENLR